MRFLLLILIGCAGASAQERLELVWPTPNMAYLRGEPLEEFIQPTVSGVTESGLFGCVRNSGMRFHEALDLKPLQRDRRGEATDPIFSVMPGIVRHVNTRPGNSGYGRYVVIEHDHVVPAVVTLYAHLQSVAAGVAPGRRVVLGEVIGVMGRSAGGYVIPKERAHLHFEIGLVVSTRFQRWYDSRKFGSPNRHGLYNGMNILGFDPLDFYNRFRAREINDVREYLASVPAAVRVRVATEQVPDFVDRYPALVSAPMPAEGIGGWEIDFTWYRVPIAWRPLPVGEAPAGRAGTFSVVWLDEEAVAANRCFTLVQRRGGAQVPGKDLEDVLQMLFAAGF